MIAVGSTVLTDGLACFRGIADAGSDHTVIVTGSGRRAARHPTFRWLNTILSNIKGSIVGTYRAVCPKHIVRTLAEFEWRFNHRTNFAAMISVLRQAALNTCPVTYGDQMVRKQETFRARSKLGSAITFCAALLFFEDDWQYRAQTSGSPSLGHLCSGERSQSGGTSLSPSQKGMPVTINVTFLKGASDPIATWADFGVSGSWSNSASVIRFLRFSYDADQIEWTDALSCVSPAAAPWPVLLAFKAIT
jgi:hypothetical protein